MYNLIRQIWTNEKKLTLIYFSISSVSFATDFDEMLVQIPRAMDVFGAGLELVSEDASLGKDEKIRLLQSNVTCTSDGPVQWAGGFRLYKYLQNASVVSSKAGPTKSAKIVRITSWGKVQ